MSVKIFDTMTTATPNFPLAYAEKINIVKEDGSEDNLQNLYDNGELGGSGGTSAQTLTQSEYDALDSQVQLEGEFYCYDSGRHFRNGVEYGKDGVQISDNETVEDKTWSSQKTSDEIAKVDASLCELEKNVKFDADDLNTAYVPNKTITVRTNKNTKNLPPSSMVNFLVTSFAYIEGQYYRITQYCYENSENLSYEMYVRRGTSNAGESSITWSDWQELATMDKVALKQEQFDKKVTLTDSNWKYETITFEKNYNNTPSVNVSCGDYLNTKFYSYWGCEAYIININNKGCNIRYRSSKASESDPLEVNIIVFVNGI